MFFYCSIQASTGLLRVIIIIWSKCVWSAVYVIIGWSFLLLLCVLEYEKKVDACKQKAAAAKLKADADEELDLLQKDLEEEEKEEHVLKDEFRWVSFQFKLHVFWFFI